MRELYNTSSPELKRTLSLLAVYRILSGLNFVTFINFIYYRLYHLSYTNIFVLLVISLATGLLAQVLAGPACDYFGYRRSMLAGICCGIAASALRAFAPSFTTFIIAAVLYAFYGAIVSVSFPALLRKELHSGHLEQYFSTAYSFYTSLLNYMSGIAAIGSGLFLLADIHIAFGIMCCQILPILLIPKPQKSYIGSNAITKSERLFYLYVKHIFKNPEACALILLAGGLVFFTYSIKDFAQALYLHTHLPLMLFGIVAGVMLFFTAIGASVAGFLKTKINPIYTLSVVLLFFLVTTLFLALFQNPYMSILIAFSGFLMGLTTVTYTVKIYELVPVYLSGFAKSLVIDVTQIACVAFFIEAGNFIDHGRIDIAFWLAMLIGGSISGLGLIMYCILYFRKQPKLQEA